MDKKEIRERFAVMNNAYRRYPFSYFLDSMEQLGFNQIDLWGGSPHFYAPEMTEKKVQALRRELRERGMKLISYTPEVIGYPYDLAAENPGLRQRSVDYFRQNLEIADALEIPVLLICPGFCEQDRPREQALLRMEESLQALLEYAGDLSVRLAVEHLTKASSNLVNRSEDLAGMLRRLGTETEDRLGCVLDLGQMSVFGETVEDFFDVLGKQIFLVHMMDGTPGGHLAFGDGRLPLESYYRQLHRAGYQGPVTLEINDRRYTPDPHSAISRCIKAMEAWQEVQG